jgi:hypothetical protein
MLQLLLTVDYRTFKIKGRKKGCDFQASFTVFFFFGVVKVATVIKIQYYHYSSTISLFK